MVSNDEEGLDRILNNLCRKISKTIGLSYPKFVLELKIDDLRYDRKKKAYIGSVEVDIERFNNPISKILLYLMKKRDIEKVDKIKVKLLIPEEFILDNKDSLKKRLANKDRYYSFYNKIEKKGRKLDIEVETHWVEPIDEGLIAAIIDPIPIISYLLRKRHKDIDIHLYLSNRYSLLTAIDSLSVNELLYYKESCEGKDRFYEISSYLEYLADDANISIEDLYKVRPEIILSLMILEIQRNDIDLVEKDENTYKIFYMRDLKYLYLNVLGLLGKALGVKYDGDFKKYLRKLELYDKKEIRKITRAFSNGGFEYVTRYLRSSYWDFLKLLINDLYDKIIDRIKKKDPKFFK